MTNALSGFLSFEICSITVNNAIAIKWPLITSEEIQKDVSSTKTRTTTNLNNTEPLPIIAALW